MTVSKIAVKLPSLNMSNLMLENNPVGPMYCIFYQLRDPMDLINPLPFIKTQKTNNYAHT